MNSPPRHPSEEGEAAQPQPQPALKQREEQEEDERAMNENLRKRVAFKHMKLFIVGDSGAGKTSVCRWLQQLPFQEQHLSTELADLTTISLQNWNAIEEE